MAITLLIRVDIEGAEETDAYQAVEDLLDSGVIQAEIEESTSCQVTNIHVVLDESKELARAQRAALERVAGPISDVDEPVGELAPLPDDTLEALLSRNEE